MLSLSDRNIRVRQIHHRDFDRLATFLCRGFRSRTREFWLQALVNIEAHQTPNGFPRFGYILEDADTIVGAILAIFSMVKEGTSTSGIRCSVSSWYVEPSFRPYAGLLVSKVFAHKGVTYVNVTAAPFTWPILAAQGYTQYSQGIFLSLPVLHYPSERVHATIVDAASDPVAPFSSFERDIVRDHAAAGCVSFWCSTPERAYPFVFRSRSAKLVPIFAQLIYCTSIDAFVRFAGSIGAHLLRRGRPFAIIDADGPIPGLAGKFFAGKEPKFYRGPHRPRLGDLAYTESGLFGAS